MPVHVGLINQVILTHTCLMDFSILINWTSPFIISGVSDVLFRSYFISNRNSYKANSGDRDQTPRLNNLNLFTISD